MSSATREQLRAAANGKRRFAVVTLPVSELEVRIRSLTAKELADLQSANFDASGNVRKNRMAEVARRFMVACVVDDLGNPELSAEDLAWLGDLDAADADYLYDQIAVHCGVKYDAEKLRKNSETTTPDDMPSA